MFPVAVRWHLLTEFAIFFTLLCCYGRLTYLAVAHEAAVEMQLYDTERQDFMKICSVLLAFFFGREVLQTIKERSRELAGMVKANGCWRDVERPSGVVDSVARWGALIVVWILSLPVSLPVTVLIQLGFIRLNLHPIERKSKSDFFGSWIVTHTLEPIFTCDLVTYFGLPASWRADPYVPLSTLYRS